MNKVRLASFYICVVCAATIARATGQVQPTAQSASDANRVRVLLLDNSKLHAIEEAASLSLDRPADIVASEQPRVRVQTHNVSRDNDASLESRQASYASLTLLQRHTRTSKLAQDADGQPGLPHSSSNNNVTSNLTSPPTNPTSANAPDQPQWPELHLVRHKPSWLDMSNRFKITHSNIQSVDYQMPNEYFLRQAFDSPILLKTKLGILEGVRSIRFNKYLYTFLSVPYAQPPVEELRFKAPKSVDKWDGILQATKWPPFCVQPALSIGSRLFPGHVLAQTMSEDCLYLNIWTPSLKFNKNSRRPVMVWIHGGGFQYGGISLDENDGSALALLGNVVVVTMSYRLNAFGFLNVNSPQLAPNNVGLLDQQKALEWVKSNIKQFGGDPQQVTLFGESAGGHSVGMHMVSPGSQPLFKRAILQSGVPVSFLRSYDVSVDSKGVTMTMGAESIKLATKLKCLEPEPSELSESPDAPNATSNNTAPATLTSNSEDANKNNDPSTGKNDDSSGDSEDSTEAPEVDAPLLSDSVIECLRNKTAAEILKTLDLGMLKSEFFPTGNDRKGFMANGPIAESYNADNLKVGPQKEYLIGTNTNEGSFFLHYGLPTIFPGTSPPTVDNIESLKTAIKTEAERRHRIAMKRANITFDASAPVSVGGSHSHLLKPLLRTTTSVLESFIRPRNATAEANGKLLDKNSEFGKNIATLLSDIIFLCPARSLAKTLSEAGRDVYYYVYDHRSSMSQYHEWMGVTHHDEVEFVFGRPLRMADVYSGKDVEMSQRMIKTWSYFAHTGRMLDQMGVSWPKYDEIDNNYMSLTSDSASVGQRYHDRMCNIYDTVIAVHLQGS